MAEFPTLSPRYDQKKTNRFSQRTIIPQSVKRRNLDIIRSSKTIQTDVDIPSGESVLFSNTIKSSLGAILIVEEDMSLFDTSISEANLIPNGSSVDMSEFQIIGPWRDYSAGDGKEIVSRILVRNILGTIESTFYPTASNDDGYETNNSSWSGGGSTLLVGADPSTADDYDAGIRFRNVTVPHGSHINSATLTITQDGSYTFGATVKANFYGIDEDDTAIFSGSDLPSSRSRTSATLFSQTLYTGPMGDGIENAYTVTSIIQEIVNRTGWSSGNSLGFYINGLGVLSDGFVDYYTYDNGTSKPKLVINYSTSTSKTVKFRIKAKYISQVHDYVTITPTVVLTKRIQSSTDDAHENTTPFYSDGADHVILGKTTVPWTGGFRFANLKIPKNAKIKSAKLTFLCHLTVDNAGDMVLDYYADAVDDSATFSSGDKPSDRTTTTSTKQQTFSTMPTVGETFESPDISSLIQEVVNRSGWAPGNAISIIVNGANGSNNNEADVVAYDEDTTEAALLTIEYTT